MENQGSAILAFVDTARQAPYLGVFRQQPTPFLFDVTLAP